METLMILLVVCLIAGCLISLIAGGYSDKKWPEILFTSCFLAMLTGGVFFHAGKADGEKNIKDLAVKASVGEYKTIIDKDGNVKVEFVFKGVEK